MRRSTLLLLALCLLLVSDPAPARRIQNDAVLGPKGRKCENVFHDRHLAALGASADVVDGQQTVTVTGECLYDNNRDLLVITVDDYLLLEDYGDCTVQDYGTGESWTAYCSMPELLYDGTYTVCARYEGKAPRDYGCTALTVVQGLTQRVAAEEQRAMEAEYANLSKINAINEANMDKIREEAVRAMAAERANMGLAEAAQIRAETGVADAATAQSAASAAQGTANGAVTDAATAQGTASAAQGTADTAVADAAKAQSAADAAQTTADGAETAVAGEATARDAAIEALQVQIRRTTQALLALALDPTLLPLALDPANALPELDCFLDATALTANFAQPYVAVVVSFGFSLTPDNRCSGFPTSDSTRICEAAFTQLPILTSTGAAASFDTFVTGQLLGLAQFDLVSACKPNPFTLDLPSLLVAFASLPVLGSVRDLTDSPGAPEGMVELDSTGSPANSPGQTGGTNSAPSVMAGECLVTEEEANTLNDALINLLGTGFLQISIEAAEGTRQLTEQETRITSALASLVVAGGSVGVNRADFTAIFSPLFPEITAATCPAAIEVAAAQP